MTFLRMKLDRNDEVPGTEQVYNFIKNETFPIDIEKPTPLIVG